MSFSDEIFNRKIEKIANFLYEVLDESGRRMGKGALVSDFFEENPLFLKQTLKDVCENIMQHILSLTEILNETKPIFPNEANDEFTNLKITNKKNEVEKHVNDSDFDIMKTFIHQFEKTKKYEFEELNWKVENYKMFMDDKTEKFFEMSHCKKLLSEKANENKENSLTNIVRIHEEEKKRLINEIRNLKDRLKEKDKDHLLEEKRLMEKEKNLFLEEEALKNQSLANSFKSREILTRSKRIGEKELLLLMQSKSHHQPSKSFSNNL